MDQTDGQAIYLQLCKALNVAPLKRFLNSLSKETINLEYFESDPRGVRAMCESLMSNDTVTKLILRENKLTNDACYHLQQLLDVNNVLTHLDLSRCRIGIEGARRIANGLETNYTLVYLNLSYNNLGDDGFKYIVDVIGKECACKRFDFSHNELGEDSARNFAAALANNTRLNYLNLSWNYLAKCRGFIAQLANGDNMEELNMSWNGLKDNVAATLKTLLQNQPLQKLDISNNALTAKGAEIIMSGITRKCALKTLNMSDNPIIPENAINVIQSLTKRKTQLETLKLKNICVKKDFLTAMEQIKTKNLVIEHGGAISNFDIKKSDMKVIVLRRAQYLGKKPKKKKLRKDFLQVLRAAMKKGDVPDVVQIDAFGAFITQTLKMRLDSNLVQKIADQFKGPRGVVDMNKLVLYLERLTQ